MSHLERLQFQFSFRSHNSPAIVLQKYIAPPVGVNGIFGEQNWQYSENTFKNESSSISPKAASCDSAPNKPSIPSRCSKLNPYSTNFENKPPFLRSIMDSGI